MTTTYSKLRKGRKLADWLFTPYHCIVRNWERNLALAHHTVTGISKSLEVSKKGSHQTSPLFRPPLSPSMADRSRSICMVHSNVQMQNLRNGDQFGDFLVGLVDCQ